MFPHYSRTLLLHHLTLHHSLEATIDALLQLSPEEVLAADSNTSTNSNEGARALQLQEPISLRQRALQTINRRWSARED